MLDTERDFYEAQTVALYAIIIHTGRECSQTSSNIFSCVACWTQTGVECDFPDVQPVALHAIVIHTGRECSQTSSAYTRVLGQRGLVDAVYSFMMILACARLHISFHYT